MDFYEDDNKDEFAKNEVNMNDNMEDVEKVPMS